MQMGPTEKGQLTFTADPSALPVPAQLSTFQVVNLAETTRQTLTPYKLIVNLSFYLAKVSSYSRQLYHDWLALHMTCPGPSPHMLWQKSTGPCKENPPRPRGQRHAEQ